MLQQLVHENNIIHNLAVEAYIQASNHCIVQMCINKDLINLRKIGN